MSEPRGSFEALPTCPSWHYLPGPYQDDPERTNCRHRLTHAEQRRRRSDESARTTAGEQS